VAHSLGETVGLGLRNLAHCPVEMNLMPDSTLRWRAFNEKKPYFIFTVASLVAVAFAVGFLFQQLAVSKEKQITDLEPKVQEQQHKYDTFNAAYKKLTAATNEVGQVTTWMEQRYYWGDVLTEMRRCLIQAEDDIKKKLTPQKPGVEAGIWIEQMTTLANLGGPGGQSASNPQMAPPPPPGNGAPAAAPGAAPDPSATIMLVCRAVDLSSIDPSANNEIAYAVENTLKNSTNYFNPKFTQLSGNITTDVSSGTGTFTFAVTVTLAKPLHL
jgi:hypothetical protein